MGYVIDIIIICVAALFVLIGIRRGFVHTAVRLVGTLAALVLSSVFGGMVAEGIYNTFFRAEFTSKISEGIAAGNLAGGAQQVLSELPELLRRALEGAGITEAKISAILASQAGDAAELISNAISPVLINLLKVLAMIVIFMILMIVVRVLANLVSQIFELPILGWVNSALGGLVGFGIALISIWFVLSVINVFVPMFSEDMQKSFNSTVGMSILADKFMSFNPFDGMFK